MTTTIITKNSSTAGAAPLAADLVQGELAVNVTDKALYTENASGTVVKLNAPSIVDNGNATAITIDSSENVGIGTSSPAALLHLAGVASPTIRFTSSSGPYSYFESNTAGSVGIAADEGNTGASSNINFRVDGSERARIDSSGNLLVGKTTASYTTAGVLITSTGIVNSAAASSDFWNTYNTTAGAYRFYVTSAGTVNATSTSISAISDQRLKENVRDLDTGLDSIMALQPRRFDWKEGKGQDKKDVAGFIAQEFETVFPECVSTSKAGEDGIEYKNINHETLIPTLVKAIQEQQALITTLTERITALEAK